MGFRVLVSRHPAIRVTGLLAFAPAGLTPAERVSLHWTHGFERYSSGFIHPARWAEAEWVQLEILVLRKPTR
jgi:hypothetical protein